MGACLGACSLLSCVSAYPVPAAAPLTFSLPSSSMYFLLFASSKLAFLGPHRCPSYPHPQPLHFGRGAPDSWCRGSGDRGGGVGRGPAPLAPPLREPGHRGRQRVQGAPRPLRAPQLGAPPGCVARLSLGRARDSLCNWQGPGPAVPTILPFWQSVRHSVCPCRLAQSVLLCLSRSHL